MRWVWVAGTWGHRWLLFGVVLALATAAHGRSVGIWKDGRSYIGDGMLKTLQEEGWQTVILAGNDLSDEAKLATLDVVFLPAGWNAYFFADFRARRALVRFTAGGKGILAGAFRSGYTRTANRPFFPEVGAAHNRVNGPYVSAFGDSVLAKTIDQPFCPNGWDHLVIKVGPLGKVFAVSGDDPVGVFGEVHGGRYICFGAFIGIEAKTEPMQGTDRRLLVAMLDWLATAPKLDDAKRAEHQARADLAFLRRELLWDWTNNDRGPDRGAGLIPNQRTWRIVPLEGRLFTLQYFASLLTPEQMKPAADVQQQLAAAVATLNANFAKEMAACEARVAKMDLAALLAENPIAEPAKVQALVEAAPGKDEAARKAMLGVVKQSAGKAPPTYAPKDVATFLHGDEVAERLFPQARLNELIAVADPLIAKLRLQVAGVKEWRLKIE